MRERWRGGAGRRACDGNDKMAANVLEILKPLQMRVHAVVVESSSSRERWRGGAHISMHVCHGGCLQM